MKQSLWLLWGSMVILLVSACSEAETLGDKDPDEVKISGVPTWENGVGRLVRTKCATCHTHPHDDITPDDTPKNFDLGRFDSDGDIQGGDSLASWINAGILEQSVGETRRMPLEFSTPLTDGEIAALKAWAQLDAPFDDAAVAAKAASDATSAEATSQQQSSSTDSSSTDTSQSGSTTDLAAGKVLYEQSSNAGRSCATCHGTEGVLSTGNGSGTDLTQGNTSQSALPAVIKRMWDSSTRTGNGTGSYSNLSSNQRENLEAYVFSLRN